MSKTTFTVKREELKVVMERIFDAPRINVFKAMTDPKSIPQWWGPRNLTTTIDTMDVKLGGTWRFVQHDTQGKEHAFHGVYQEIDPPKLVSNTFNYEGIPGKHELVETVTLEDLNDSQTKVISTSIYANVEDLDGMVGSGMEAGAVETWERLAELVE